MLLNDTQGYQGAELILRERKRQIEELGRDAAGDDLWIDGQLARAAGCYFDRAQLLQFGHGFASPGDNLNDVPLNGPWWPADWWKPSKEPVRNYVKAGALWLAEAARYDRAGATHNARYARQWASDCAFFIDDVLNERAALMSIVMAKHGKLHCEGREITAEEGDEIACRHGFSSSEKLVKHLESLGAFARVKIWE